MRTATLFFLLIILFSCRKNREMIPAPTALTVTAISDTGSTIHWQAVSAAENYRVFISTDSSFSSGLSGYNPKLVEGSTLHLDSLTPYTRYFIKVVAAKGDLESAAATAAFTTLDADRFVLLGGENNRFYALDARTGKIQWSYATGNIIASTPVVNAGTVYVGSWDGKLYAIDVANGSLRWSAFTGGPIASGSPAVRNGLVYIGNYSGQLWAYDAQSGSPKWSYRIESPYPNIGVSPVIKDSLLYIGSYDGSIYALNAANGALKWKSASFGNPVVSSAAISNGALYVGGNTRLHNLDLLSGATRWASGVTANGLISSSPTVYNGMVYIGSEGGTLYAFDTATGGTRWSALLGNGGSIMSSPVVSEGYLYVGGGDGRLYALDPHSGAIIWTSTGTGNKNIYSGPTVSKNVLTHTVYFGSLEGSVFALDAKSGTTKWNSSIGTNFSSSPCVISYSGKVLYPGISGEVQ